MAKETTRSGKKGDWQRLIKPLEGNSELAYLETHRAKLAGLLDQAVDLTRQQNALTASKQELSQQIAIVMTEGQRTATILRKSIAAHYGIRAEKLAEFGLQPFRGRQKPKPAPETPDSAGGSTSTPLA